MDEDKQDLIKQQVENIRNIERTLTEYEQGIIAAYPQFQEWIERSRQAQEQIAAGWDAVAEAMIANNVKSFKGDFGSLTITERTTFETNEDLPDEYYKRVPDAKKIGVYYSLTGEAPEGATPKVTRFLSKRLKG